MASVAQWVGSLLIQETNVLLEVADQVESLQEDLEVMQAYLIDADAKQHVREVCTLTGQMRKVAYDIEDVIDTYILKVETKNEGQGYRDWFVKFACFVRSAPHIYQVGKQIEVIQKNMKRIREQLNSCGLRGAFESREGLRSLSYNERHSRKQPQCFPYDDCGEYIVGLDKDMSKLVEILMGEENHQLNIVSIVGMGGSGKTTLAKKLYNHPYSKECFDCCAWVSISQEWSTKHVLSEILRKVGGPNAMTGLSAKPSKEELVDKLRDILEKKSYLVVLDDVWRKEALEDIFPALLLADNKRGSKIIITTRNQEVFQFKNLQKHLYIHEAKPLSEEHAWKLFSKIAFDQCDCNIQSFENLGKEMLRKCDGLPLAIVALAGILSSKGSIKEWQQVSDVVRSRVMESTGSHTSGTIGVMLALSYDDLPYDLKACFLYLGVFPEDCQIATGMLTRMWMAEGLVAGPQEMLEDIAMQNLEKLSHRFMIQIVRTNFKGEIKAIRLHDLLRDLCVKNAKEQGFLKIYASVSEQVISDVHASAIQPRRAALHSCITFPTQVSHLRSLVLLATSSFALSAPLSKDMLDLQSVNNHFKLLRLLSLWGIKTPNGTLPAQIGSLIHLRYLGIRMTNITELPRSIGNLRNLLTLDYRNIESDFNASIEIPDVLWKLMRLRHLFLPIECPWRVKNLNLSTLRDLQTLWGVKDDREGCWLSGQFPELSATLKKLMVVVSSEKELVDCFSSPSIMSDGLHTFHCKLRNGLALRHVKPLSDQQRLHKLTLIGQLQTKLSLLVPANIIVLELKDSVLENEDPMIALGALAHLKLLRLSNSYLGTTFACKPGSFPQLEELYLHNFQNLKTWRIEKGAMLCLKRLEIMGCKKLQHFPQGLALLTNLKQLEFFVMPKEFEEKAREHGWSQKSLRLPHKCEAIIKKSDSAIDVSSIHRIYEQLIAGIFLNNKQQKFWVVKRDQVYYNCFMVYVADLYLATQVDIDGLPLWNAQMGHWKFSDLAERDGALIKVAKLSVPEIHVLDVGGRINIGDLSPNATYAIACIIRFDDNQVHVQSTLFLPNRIIQTHKRTLRDRPKNEWIQVPVGEFERPSNYEGVAEFSLHLQWERPSKVGFEIRGAIIEPKPLAADI